MAFDYVVSATERSFFRSNAPTYAQVLGALQHVPLGDASWVGPAPRVTRRVATPDLNSFVTRVAWAFEVAGPYSQAGADAVAQRVRGWVEGALAAIPSADWDAAVVAPYDPAVNGPLAWWADGRAAATPTRDEFPSAFASEENPVGPTTPVTAPPTAAQNAAQQAGEATSTALAPLTGGGPGGAPSAIQQTTSLITTVGVVAAVGVGLYLLWPVLTGVRSRVGAHARGAAYANPRRRSHRRRRAA